MCPNNIKGEAFDYFYLMPLQNMKALAQFNGHSRPASFVSAAGSSDGGDFQALKKAVAVIN